MTTHYGVRVNGEEFRMPDGVQLVLFGTATACGAVPESYESMTVEHFLVSCEECSGKLGGDHGRS